MYSLFLGCIAPLRYPGIESATRQVLSALNIEYNELEGASCCPAPGVMRSFDEKTWLSIASRNLQLSEKKGAELLTICNGCYGSLFEAAHILEHDEGKRAKVNEIIDGDGYNGTTKVRHIAEVLYRELGVDEIKSKVNNGLKLNVAVHYGCHFLKPSKIKKLDDPERPTMLDELIEATGAVSVSYKDKQMCCGAGGGVRAGSPNVALDMTRNKVDNMKAAGAQCVVTPCPFCHLQFDRGQKELGEGYDLPVIHLSQILGLALGVDNSKLGFESHVTPVDSIL
ncbi:MAG: CoB--CoM heterodisulfide reductase subunit B [Halobacteriota archaeon]|nr:CoB--CoM heterodisulfide reductase subunit B [Halobacteriota archaeon]